MEDFSQLLEAYLPKKEQIFQIGEKVKGRIVKISEDFTYVAIGGKKEALLPTEEIKDKQGNFLFNQEDEITALVIKKMSGGEVYLLSVKKILEEEAKKELNEAYKQSRPIKVKVLKPIKGGFEVEYRGLLKGFLPKSQSGFQSIEEIGEEEIYVLLQKLEDDNFVVSRRAYLEKMKELKLKEIEKLIKDEAVLNGKIKKSVKGGFLVDFDGIVGYLPFSEITRRKIKNIENYLKEGDTVKVKVLEWDPVNKKLRVSAKALEPDPWVDVERRYTIDQRVRGRITKVENFGAFVEIEPGLEGLLPASEISWKRGLKPKDLLNEDDWIEGVILELNPTDRKIILSLKRLEESPWEKVIKEVKVGDVVSGKVKTMTNFGLFVEVAEGVEGFIHISKISWERVENLEEMFKVGDEISARVIEIDSEKKKLILSIRDLTEDPWKEVGERFKVGDNIEGVVVNYLQGKGYLVRVAEGVIGFLPERELGGETKKEKRLLNKGEPVKGKIILLDSEKRKLWLSERAYLEELERKEIEEFKMKEEGKKHSLGERMKQIGLVRRVEGEGL
ncbi:MAG: S1 RNA-binding domain-containing protein [Caldimicrobium sp.]